VLTTGVAPLLRLFQQTRSEQAVWEVLLDFSPARVRPCLSLVSFGLEAPRPRGLEVDPAPLQTRLRPFTMALESPDRKAADKAVEVVRSLGLGSLPALIEGLKSERPNVQIASAELIGEFGPWGQPAVEPLRRLLKQGNAALRLRATITLGVIGPVAEAAVGDLIEAVGDSDEEVRHWAARSLGRIGPAARAAVPALLTALEGKDENLRYIAANALGDIKVAEKKVIDALVRRLVEKDTSNTKSWAAYALGQFGPAAKGAIPHLVEVIQRPQLSDAQEDGAVDRCLSMAADALGEMGEEAKDAVPVLVKLLHEDLQSRPLTVRAAAVALAKIGSAAREPALPAMRELLKRIRRGGDGELERAVKEAYDKLAERK
jgi:HEAT repeat protein